MITNTAWSASTPLCNHRQIQTIKHIVEICSLTKYKGGTVSCVMMLFSLNMPQDGLKDKYLCFSSLIKAIAPSTKIW